MSPAPRRCWAAGRVGLLALALAAGALSIGNASSLTLTGGSVSSLSAQHPCSGTGTATAASSTAIGSTSYAGVAVTVPSSCGTRAIQVTVLSGASVVASGSGTVTTSGTIATSPYTATAGLTVKATVAGWDLPLTWSFTPHSSCSITSVGSTASCASTVTMYTGTRGTSEALYFDVVVHTDSPTWVTWTVTFDLSHSYYNVQVVRLGNSDFDAYNDGTTTWNSTNRVNDVIRTSQCTALPTLTATGIGDGTVSTGWWAENQKTNERNFSLVRSDYDRKFSLVVNRTEAGYHDVLAPGC